MNRILIKILLTFFFVCLTSTSIAQNKIYFFQTSWGNQHSYENFCKRVKASGFDGIDLWLPSKKEDQIALKRALDKYDLKLNLMHGTNKNIPFDQSLIQYENKLRELIKWNPILINSHTGSDFFTIEQNKEFILIANKLSEAHNIPIYHETHRGRFSYTLPDTQKYIDAIPELRLTLDISHWMVVHESLLQGKNKELQNTIDRTDHIHARVGYAEGPQVNDPEAPEWEKALKRHLDIWEQIIRKGWKRKEGVFTVTSEFGPANYMQTLPYTQIPVADQWKANVFIMNAIKQRMNLE